MAERNKRLLRMADCGRRAAAVHFMIRYQCKSQPKKCPSCGAHRIARILYGLPAASAELKGVLDDGTVVLGGCCVSRDDPKWRCTACDTSIYQTTPDADVTTESKDAT